MSIKPLCSEDEWANSNVKVIVESEDRDFLDFIIDKEFEKLHATGGRSTPSLTYAHP
jgi:hypothetical protein